MIKNSKHYFLYFFALIFSAMLVFSFLTISTNKDIVQLQNSSVKAGGVFYAGAVILFIIVIMFVIYANQLFMKRRSKEIGLYQIIGMPKSTINFMLLIENIILWIIAVTVGVFLGFVFSRLFTLIFLKVIQNEKQVELYFSSEALWQTLIAFSVLLVIVLLQAVRTVSKSKLLDLFHASGKAEQRVTRLSTLKIVLGLVGIALIIYGYYRSTILFKADTGNSISDLFIAMLIILLSVILGTFLVFHYSVSFILNAIRSSRKGHLRLADVLAVSPIMHRMRSSSISLSLITILTALALGVLSLTSIAYYNITVGTNQNMPSDYITYNNQGTFQKSLNAANIDYEKQEYNLLVVKSDTDTLMKEPPKEGSIENRSYKEIFLKQSDVKSSFPKLTLKNDEAYIAGYSNIMDKLLTMEAGRDFEVDMNGLKKQLTLKGIEKKGIASTAITSGNPTYIISDALFDELSQEKHIQKQTFWKTFQAYNVAETDLKRSNDLYYKSTNDGQFKSAGKLIQTAPKEKYKKIQTENMGLIIFISGFIGLAFLLATGSILYFKQMSEAEEERYSFMMMRKIGFTVQEIMRGIYVKQLINFGFPLLIGLLHSYFAVKSGWMFFGSELYTPMFITMGIYVVLYSVFAVLTARYYRKIVLSSL